MFEKQGVIHVIHALLRQVCLTSVCSRQEADDPAHFDCLLSTQGSVTSKSQSIGLGAWGVGGWRDWIFTVSEKMFRTVSQTNCDSIWPRVSTRNRSCQAIFDTTAFPPCKNTVGFDDAKGDSISAFHHSNRVPHGCESNGRGPGKWNCCGILSAPWQKWGHGGTCFQINYKQLQFRSRQLYGLSSKLQKKWWVMRLKKRDHEPQVVQLFKGESHMYFKMLHLILGTLVLKGVAKQITLYIQVGLAGDATFDLSELGLSVVPNK